MGQANYIICGSDRYIDTNYIAKLNSRIVIRYKAETVPTTTHYLCGSSYRYGQLAEYRFSIFGNSSNTWVSSYNDTADLSFGSYPLTEIRTIELSTSAVKVNDVAVKTFVNSFTDYSYNMYIGTVNTTGYPVSHGTNWYVYSCQIYDGNTLVRDYTPWKKDGAYCFYDRVAKTYTYSATSTALGGNGGDGSTYDLTEAVPKIVKKSDILNCPYSGGSKSIKLQKGKYRLETWGAEGGYRSSNTYSGKGGYSVGTLTLDSPQTLYLYAGGNGNNRRSNNAWGGFNGGGARLLPGGGGGASDIRIGSDSLYARVIVAGGGGSDGAATKPGKYGGGTSGGSATESYGSVGYGGTQTGNQGGSSYMTTTKPSTMTSLTDTYSGFGFGGNGVSYANGYGGAGGGGWYGGCGSYPDGSLDDDRGGGGGSGYVYMTSTAANYPSGCLLQKGYYLTDASTIAGNTAFTSPEGVLETGHSGNGYCRITVLEAENTFIYKKTNGSWKLVSDNIINEDYSIGASGAFHFSADGKIYSAEYGMTWRSLAEASSGFFIGPTGVVITTGGKGLTYEFGINSHNEVKYWVMGNDLVAPVTYNTILIPV